MGGRLDLWQLEIDWVQNPGSAAERRGETETLVLQPTIRGGYRWRLGDSGWNLELNAAVGAEINVSTAGEEVGEGAIGLVGIGLAYSL